MVLLCMVGKAQQYLDTASGEQGALEASGCWALVVQCWPCMLQGCCPASWGMEVAVAPSRLT